jgi:hypothetical protein
VRARRLQSGRHDIAESATNNDRIEQANQMFWTPPSLEELMADVAPLDPGEDFDMPDEEWAVFEQALEHRLATVASSWITPLSREWPWLCPCPCSVAKSY